MTSPKGAMLTLAIIAVSGSCDWADADVIVQRHSESVVSVNLRVGQRLILRTAPAPLTAYYWQVELPLNQQIIAMTGPPTYESKTRNLPGGLQVTRFDFIGTGAGQIVAKFNLFAGQNLLGSNGIDHFALRITVRP